MRLFVWCHQVNLKAHHVEYNRFYIPDITSLVDIQEDYLKWFLNKAEIVSLTASTNVSGLLDDDDYEDADAVSLYCHYPSIIKILLVCSFGANVSKTCHYISVFYNADRC